MYFYAFFQQPFSKEVDVSDFSQTLCLEKQSYLRQFGKKLNMPVSLTCSAVVENVERKLALSAFCGVLGS